MPQWKDFVSWVFFGILAFFAYSLTSNVEKMRESVEKLNVNVAVVFTKIDGMEGRIQRLETTK